MYTTMPIVCNLSNSETVLVHCLMHFITSGLRLLWTCFTEFCPFTVVFYSVNLFFLIQVFFAENTMEKTFFLNLSLFVILF